jgi:hypothetical protein
MKRPRLTRQQRCAIGQRMAVTGTEDSPYYRQPPSVTLPQLAFLQRELPDEPPPRPQRIDAEK